MKKLYVDYCVGCGLCESVGKAECNIDERGFMYPVSGDDRWLGSVCPVGGKQQLCMDFSSVWGRKEAVYYGWSTDDALRHMASSGGAITETASWLLDKGYVDAVLHTMADPVDPTKTICCISESREELIAKCGSRYSISHPLSIISELLPGKRYAFIGKPCDVTALKNYMELDQSMSKRIPYTLSFFCAGLPSIDAQEQLLDFVGCEKGRASSLRYRGDGWPGYTIVKDKKGSVYKTDYNTSWGKILGRDIMRACRFCLDGVGEMADISCGDAWYLDTDHLPNFTEADGRNIIFARTPAGKAVLDEMISSGRLEVVQAPIQELRYIQKYQWKRRATMIDRCFALKLMGRPVPRYKTGNIIKYGKGLPIKEHLSVLKGTIKRISDGKI